MCLNEALYKVREAAVAAEVPGHALYYLIYKGKIEVVRFSNKDIWIPHSELERLYGVSFEVAEQRLRDSGLWPPIPEVEPFDFDSFQW